MKKLRMLFLCNALMPTGGFNLQRILEKSQARLTQNRVEGIKRELARPSASSRRRLRCYPCSFGGAADD
jgi:hypothetical protein